MESYEKEIFRGYLIQGKLKKGIAYLEQFPEMKGKVQLYQELFEKNGEKSCGNRTLDWILKGFREYYREVFWKETEEKKAREQLTEYFSSLWKGRSGPKEIGLEILWEQDVEPKLKEVVEKEGYHYLGGETQGFLGPYIWKDSKKLSFEAKLPADTETVTVRWLSGFLSLSWLDDISMKECGTGGWAGEDGVLNCVAERWPDGTDSEAFQWDFLKHEAQHALDKRRWPEMSGTKLEYRAKLAQLIRRDRPVLLLNRLIKEADGENPKNTHAYASFLLVRDLSEKIFGESDVEEVSRWESKSGQISDAALELYFKSSCGMENV